MLCPTLVPPRLNSPHSAAFAQLKTRFGRGSPSSPRKIWPSQSKTLAIAGKIRETSGVKIAISYQPFSYQLSVELRLNTEHKA